jgi:FlaA1/EpsC-like NDP-sugar epimerase
MTWTLVTGGTGDIGTELVRELLLHGEKVRVLSRDQSRQAELRDWLETRECPDRWRLFIGDVRDPERLKRAFEGVKTVYHLAAMKHVDSCEYNPEETVKTNVMGTANVIGACLACGVERMVFSSSDKAASPDNLMGGTKYVAEKLVVDAAFHSKCQFNVARFGNVLGSRGSVLPRWRQQLQEQGYMAVTDPLMTRYVMDVKGAVRLLRSAVEEPSGVIVLAKMPVVRLADLASVFASAWERGHQLEAGSTRQVIAGARPGETISEMLFTAQEALRTRHNPSFYYILPAMAFTSALNHAQIESLPLVDGPCDSDNETPMTRDALRDWLMSRGLI